MTTRYCAPPPSGTRTASGSRAGGWQRSRGRGTFSRAIALRQKEHCSSYPAGRSYQTIWVSSGGYETLMVDAPR